MKQFCVTFKINTKYYAVVDANNVKDAKLKAEQKFMDTADIGDLEFVDAVITLVEDEHGHILESEEDDLC